MAVKQIALKSVPGKLSSIRQKEISILKVRCAGQHAPQRRPAILLAVCGLSDVQGLISVGRVGGRPGDEGGREIRKRNRIWRVPPKPYL